MQSGLWLLSTRKWRNESMAMKSKDVIKQELNEKFGKAMQSKDPEALTEAFAEFAVSMQQDILADYKAFQQTQDSAILAKRGIRQLTQQESNFYTAMAKAAASNDPKMAFTGIDNTTLPMSVLDAVISDIGTEFPLLDAINFQNVSALTKMIVNKQGIQMAVWGPLNSKITEELAGAIGTINVGLTKLTAFIPVDRDMIDAGPEWMDAYARAILAEALGLGLCQGAVAGTGNNQPIGMLKDLSAAVTNGVYSDKAAITITDLSPTTIGGIAATLAKGPNNRMRKVPNILIVVNPVDYFNKLMPATTYLTPQGTYVNNVLPYPCTIIQDINVPSGKAIFGLAERYFLGVGKGGKSGTVETSDEFEFLDDKRVYKVKAYGDGQPLDNNAFVIADISGLKPLTAQVIITNPTTNPVNTKATT
jgi:HK97 family phage major capsid protein